MAAQALTWLQIINRVLARLREGTVASNDTNTYSSMIGALVNAVKSEMEQAYPWSALRETYSVSAVPSTTNYSLTSSGMNCRIIDGWNTSTGLQLEPSTNADFNAKFFGLGTASLQTGAPEQYLPAGLDANYDQTVDIWPSPSATNALKFNVYVPQIDLAANGDVPLVPQDVLIEEVYARAIAERGDEGAAQPAPGMTFIRTDLLSSAISRESANDGSETDWEVE